MSTYTGTTPSSVTVDPRIVQFFEKFYTFSDDPSAHDEYCDSFTSDADFVMGTRVAKGAKETRILREGLWTGPVKSRKHTLHKIFPFGDNATEVMAYGEVAYVLKNGKDVNVEWAGRAVFTEDSKDGKLRMKFYQVYLDSAPVMNALKD